MYKKIHIISFYFFSLYSAPTRLLNQLIDVGPGILQAKIKFIFSNED